jgi:hypothetical protein
MNFKNEKTSYLKKKEKLKNLKEHYRRCKDWSRIVDLQQLQVQIWQMNHAWTQRSTRVQIRTSSHRQRTTWMSWLTQLGFNHHQLISIEANLTIKSTGSRILDSPGSNTIHHCSLLRYKALAYEVQTKVKV